MQEIKAFFKKAMELKEDEWAPIGDFQSHFMFWVLWSDLGAMAGTMSWMFCQLWLEEVAWTLQKVAPMIFTALMAAISIPIFLAGIFRIIKVIYNRRCR